MYYYDRLHHALHHVLLWQHNIFHSRQLNICYDRDTPPFKQLYRLTTTDVGTNIGVMVWNSCNLRNGTCRTTPSLRKWFIPVQAHDKPLGTIAALTAIVICNALLNRVETCHRTMQCTFSWSCKQDPTSSSVASFPGRTSWEWGQLQCGSLTISLHITVTICSLPGLSYLPIPSTVVMLHPSTESMQGTQTLQIENIWLCNSRNRQLLILLVVSTELTAMVVSLGSTLVATTTQQPHPPSAHILLVPVRPVWERNHSFRVRSGFTFSTGIDVDEEGDAEDAYLEMDKE